MFFLLFFPTPHPDVDLLFGLGLCAFTTKDSAPQFHVSCCLSLPPTPLLVRFHPCQFPPLATYFLPLLHFLLPPSSSFYISSFFLPLPPSSSFIHVPFLLPSLLHSPSISSSLPRPSCPTLKSFFLPSLIITPFSPLSHLLPVSPIFSTSSSHCLYCTRDQLIDGV